MNKDYWEERPYEESLPPMQYEQGGDYSGEFDKEPEGWQEYWLVVGGVSHLAEQAIESVGGRVERLMAHHNLSTSLLFAVCLLHDEHDEDDDQGFGWFTDDGEKARQLYICSADAHHDLYIYCVDGSIPRFETGTPELRIITEAEWFAMDEE